jgi:hypothetical protein
MISKHISDKEGVYSNTALRLGIENKPNKEQLKNMKTIAKKIFEPLRKHAGGPIKITSFFRAPELNKACVEDILPLFNQQLNVQVLLFPALDGVRVI